VAGGFLRASIKDRVSRLPVSCSLLVLPTNCLGFSAADSGRHQCRSNGAAAMMVSRITSPFVIKSKGAPRFGGPQAAIFSKHTGMDTSWTNRKGGCGVCNGVP